MNILYSLLFCYLLLGFSQCTNITAKQAKNQLSNEALLDTVQHRTFRYFWEGAEPNSGLARERIHMDGIYPENDQNIVTSGGSGFGIMAILAGIDRGYVTREEGLNAWSASSPSLKQPIASMESILIGGMETLVK